jgi:signal transduction histidine kinase/putative methionine-R-sulfoxide reductase with GAF domain
MTLAATEPTLPESLLEASRIARQCKDRQEALQRITELGRAALGSQLCTLTFVDLKDRALTQGAFAGVDSRYDGLKKGKSFKLGTLSAGDYLDFKLISRDQIHEFHGLHEDGQGVANPDVARRYELHSLLSCPLEAERQLIGYFNHFTSSDGPFTADEKKLVQLFAELAAVTIDRFHRQQTHRRALGILGELSESLIAELPEDTLKKVCAAACKILSVPTAIVWKLDPQGQTLRVAAATDDVDEEYRKVALDVGSVREHFQTRKVSFLTDVRRPHPLYAHSTEAKARDWVSVLTASVWNREHQPIGMLDVYTNAERCFKGWEKELFSGVANYVALSLQKADERSKSRMLQHDKRMLSEHTAILQEMTAAENEGDLLNLLLDRALALVGAGTGWISRYNLQTGELNVITHRGQPLGQKPSLRLGKGITGKALQEGRAIVVDDVRSDNWKGIYVKCWDSTRSELAIPLICNATIRKGRDVIQGVKRIGVLNIESPAENAFSEAHKDVLWSLVRHAAFLIDRFESDLKRRMVAEIERQVMGQRNWDGTIQTVMNAIKGTLGYEFVNISVVRHEHNCIRTEFISGLPATDQEPFKKMAVHSLDSGDIQADIVRTRNIEVPPPGDPRFDSRILDRFDHDRFIRVYMPLVASAENQVVGTVETGYLRSNREYIYEQDVQLLRELVEFVAIALEQRKHVLLEQTSHEFRQALIGIRSNASFLQRRLEELPPKFINLKFDDMMLDCELLFLQVAELEYVLGRPRPPSKFEKTLVMRDIVVKTIKQLKPLVDERRFDYNRVMYFPEDIGKILIYVDRVKMNQVVYNLLINSIKYAEENPAKFAIRVDVDETQRDFIIRFRDWGIGIRPEFRDKVFEDGFRTPEAINMDVSGSGLGLPIARSAIHEIGGELKLVNTRKPTEFQVTLPKSLKELPR